MFDNLRQYLCERGNFTESDLKTIESLCIPKVFKKNQFLLRAGDTCRYHTFVSTGCLRLYRLNANGQEHIIKFATEQWWVSDRESLITGKPGESYIEALEKTEVLQWTNENFEELFRIVPSFDQLFKVLMSRALDATAKRVYTSISANAEEKYLDFAKKYPTLLSRVPLHMIASYLGVTRETLTRVRRITNGKEY